MSLDIKKPLVFNKRSDAPSSAKVVDAYQGALKELFFIDNPKFKKGAPEAEKKLKNFLKNQKISDIWIYYAWKNLLVRSVPEELYFRLRTARNRNIISEEEQKNYRKIKIGIAGLSVGSAVLSALVISGGPKTIKIADFDTVELTNLNRLRASLADIGESKTLVAARQVWELDPFAEIYPFPDGISKRNIANFLLNEPRLDIFVDEMDSIDLKILSRLICREHKIPVLMATDNGDGVILDVERFDLESKREIFHGLIGEIRAADVQDLDYRKWLELATKIVVPEYLTERMQDSLLVIGKTIPAIPQLGTSASLAGSVIAYALRRLANGQALPSGRYQIGLEEKLDPIYNQPKEIKKRKKNTQEFIKKFGQKK